jgi:hypothetical protein
MLKIDFACLVSRLLSSSNIEVVILICKRSKNGGPGAAVFLHARRGRLKIDRHASRVAQAINTVLIRPL